MFDSIFGKKTSHSRGNYGKKDESIFHKGVKFIAEKAGSVADVAGTVGDVAGVGAAAAATTGLEPVAAGLLAVAGGAKGIAAGARVAGSAARGTLAAETAIDKARSGDIMGAVQAGKSAGAQFASAKGGAKAIQRTRK